MSATRTDADGRTDRRSDRIVRSAPTEHRFRAATVDEALAQVRASLGEDVEIVEANRIRRGGIGGFFATELGVEVVARTNGADDRADVFEPFEPFDDASFTAAAAPPRVDHAVTPTVKPAPRAWTVDNGIGAHVVADPSMPAARARQAWREATRTPDAEAQVAARLPGFDAPSDQDAVVDQPQESVADPVADRQPTTFAEHFLRELVQDAEQLRRSSDRNRVLPIRGAADDARSIPMGRPEPLAGTPVALATAPVPAPSPESAPVVAEEPPTLPGMPAPTPKRRAKRSGTGRTKSTAERRAEAEAAAAAAEAATAAEAAEAAAAAVSAAPAHAMIGGLIDQCVALTSSVDDTAAPSKIALAVTLPDGSVMKVSIERPRRAGRSVRDAAGA